MYQQLATLTERSETALHCSRVESEAQKRRILLLKCTQRLAFGGIARSWFVWRAHAQRQGLMKAFRVREEHLSAQLADFQSAETKATSEAAAESRLVQMLKRTVEAQHRRHQLSSEQLIHRVLRSDKAVALLKRTIQQLQHALRSSETAAYAYAARLGVIESEDGAKRVQHLQQQQQREIGLLKRTVQHLQHSLRGMHQAREGVASSVYEPADDEKALDQSFKHTVTSLQANQGLRGQLGFDVDTRESKEVKDGKSAS
jgi:hypothetical protein